MRETCPCCGAPCITSTETSASPTAVRRYAPPEAGRLSPDMALLERCREICMRVSHEAEDAAKAKDATDYVAGYQDACVDVDEEIRELMKELPERGDMDVLIANAVTAARASGHARGRGEDDEALNKAEDEAVSALRTALLPQSNALQEKE